MHSTPIWYTYLGYKNGFLIFSVWESKAWHDEFKSWDQWISKSIIVGCGQTATDDSAQAAGSTTKTSTVSLLC